MKIVWIIHSNQHGIFWSSDLSSLVWIVCCNVGITEHGTKTNAHNNLLMIVFEISINKTTNWRIGVPEKGVLSAMVGYAKHMGEDLEGTGLSLTSGALHQKQDGADEQFKWPKHLLHFGDEIVIKITQGETCDVPSSVNTEAPEVRIARMRRTLAALQKELADK